MNNIISKYVIISGLINSLIILKKSSNVKVKRIFGEDIKTPILLTEKIYLASLGFIIGWTQFPYKLYSEMCLAEIYMRGYNSKDFGYNDINHINEILF